MGRLDLSSHDLLGVLDFAAATSALGWSDGDPAQLLAPLRELVSCDFATLTVLDVARHRSTSDAHPGNAISPELYESFERHSDQHPYVRHHAATGAHGVERITDLVPNRKWRQTALYAEHFRPLTAEHQLCTLLGTCEGALIGLSLSRSSVEFSDRDRDVVELAQPHLSAAFLLHRRLQDLERRLDALTLDALAPNAGPGSAVAKLTRREQQVAALIGRGLADKQIATQLGISPRTVHKHVEHILGKLDVHSRTVIANTAWPDQSRPARR